MNKLSIVLDHKRMVTTSKMAMLNKSIEMLYYGLLFSTPAYGQRHDKWTQWQKMGFDVAVMEAPRAAAIEDKLRFDTASLTTKTEITVQKGNTNVLKQLQQLLSDLDKARVENPDQGKRWEAAMDLSSVKDKLLRPLTDSVKADGLRPEEIANYLEKMREAITTLTEDNLASLKVRQPASVQ